MNTLLGKLRFDQLIGYIISLMGFIAFVMNLVTFIVVGRFHNIMGWFSLVPLFTFPAAILTVTVLSHVRIYPYQRWGQIIQVVLLFANSCLAILDDISSSNGVALLFLALLLAYKYKLYNLRRMIVVIVLICGITLFSAWNKGVPSAGVLLILFYIFFLTIAGLAYQDSLKQVRMRNRRLREVVGELKDELKTREQISEELTAISLDVEAFSFTPAEKEILQLMCVQGITSNKDLAETLNKSVSTIKTQLTSMFEKTGIHKRSQLIARFRE